MKNLSTYIGLLFIAVFALSSSGAVMAMEWKIQDTLLEEVERGETTLVRALLARGNAEKKDGDGCTLLQKAVRQGHKKLVEAMLTEGADATITDNRGIGLLHNVARRGWVDTAKLLITKGLIKVDATTSYGATPLHSVMQAHRLSYYAGIDSQLVVVKLLLAEGAEVNTTNQYGFTPLRMAVEWGAPKAVITTLLDAGADAHIPDNDGKRPVDFAKTDAVRELLES